MNIAQLHFPFGVYQFFFGKNQAYPFGMTMGLAPKGPPVWGWDGEKGGPTDTILSLLDSIAKGEKIKDTTDPKKITDELDILIQQALEQKLIIRTDQNYYELTDAGKMLVREWDKIPILPDFVSNRIDLIVGRF